MKKEGKIVSIIGNSGSGKTSGHLIPEIKHTIEDGQSFVLVDPKNDALQYIGNSLKINNYKVVVLNLRDQENSVFWNPLWLPYKYYINNKKEESYDLLNAMAESIFTHRQTSNSDPFWDYCARDLFVGLALGLFENCENEDQINLQSVYLMALESGDKYNAKASYLKKYLDLQEDRFSYETSCLNTTANAPSDTQQSILVTFYQKLRNVTMNNKYSSTICMKNDNIDIEGLLKEKVAFILQYEDELIEPPYIINMFIHQIVNIIIDNETKTRKKIGFSVFFEDFLTLKKYFGLDNLILSSKSRYLNLYFCINNISLLNKIYGIETAHALLENSDHIVFTSHNNKDTREYLSRFNHSILFEQIKQNESICIDDNGKYYLVKKQSAIKSNYEFFEIKHQSNSQINRFSLKKYVDKKIHNNVSFNGDISKIIHEIDKKIAVLEAQEEEEKAKM